MAIKIHHGPNGSYKTSGAVWDDAVPAAKDGRLIITNIRGMSSERFHEVFPDLPDTFELEYINHETSEGMERIRTWFQWAPRNAFLIFDEAQTLFPKKWTDKYLERFDYPATMDSVDEEGNRVPGLNSQDAAHAADRPMNFLDAWTRHRHWNWDVILTTPNIKYVHDEIRGTSEAAYQHSNLKLLGAALKFLVGKDYKEAMHSAQENKAPTDGSNIVQLRKIDKRVFKLYDSTATGLHRDTMAGKNALASPRVLILLAVLVGICGTLYYRHGTSMFNNPLSVQGQPKAVSTNPPATQVPASPSSNSNPSPAPVRVPDSSPSEVPQVVRTDPFGQYDISVLGSIWNDRVGVIFTFLLEKNDSKLRLTSKDMQVAGYDIRARGTCAADLTFEGKQRTVACLGQQASGRSGEERLGAERRAAAASHPEYKPTQVTIVADSSRSSR